MENEINKLNQEIFNYKNYLEKSIVENEKLTKSNKEITKKVEHGINKIMKLEKEISSVKELDQENSEEESDRLKPENFKFKNIELSPIKVMEDYLIPQDSSSGQIINSSKRKMTFGRNDDSEGPDNLLTNETNEANFKKQEYINKIEKLKKDIKFLEQDNYIAKKEIERLNAYIGLIEKSTENLKIISKQRKSLISFNGINLNQLVDFSFIGNESCINNENAVEDNNINVEKENPDDIDKSICINYKNVRRQILKVSTTSLSRMG